MALSAGPNALPVLRVSVTTTGAPEHERVVDLRPDNRQAIDEARIRFVQVAKELVKLGSLEAAIGAIGLAAKELLADADLAEARAINEAS